MVPIRFVNDKVLQQNDKPAFRGADGEKQIDHSDNGTIASEDENTSAVRLLKN